MPSVTILGVGNVMNGDEAFGPHVVRRLQAFYQFDPEVTILDARDLGVHLISNISGADLLIVVCPIIAEGPSGELRLFRKDQILSNATTTPFALQNHEVKTALLLLELADEAPWEVLLIGVIPKAIEPGVTMRPAVEAAVRRGELEVLKELFQTGYPPQRAWLPVDPEISAQSASH